jgi:putative hemolysin
MELISLSEFKAAIPLLNRFGGDAFVRGIFNLLRFDRVNEFYSKNHHLQGPDFFRNLIRDTGIHVKISDEDIARIPTDKGFITVSNHPYGGIDGVLLAKVISEVNPDYKLLVNFLLTRIEPLRPYFLGVNPFESQKDLQSSFGGLKEALMHLKQGFPLGIFPAGQVSCYQLGKNGITDREWQYTILRFIKRAKVPVLPVYFSGHNSITYNMLGLIHPALRTIKLPSELFNKPGHEITIRIGNPVSVKEQDEFREVGEYGKLLRLKTYSLGLSVEKSSHGCCNKLHKPVDIKDAVDQGVIKQEVSEIPAEYLLFRIQENSIFCVPSAKIPNIMNEIGRLREITYREVGEGTNNEADLDQFDSYFEQLFIWDDHAKRITGGYRVGKGDEIIERFGIKGHYINSLFKIDRSFESILRVSLELGRSFIVKEYQKKPLSLFLLWKGILYLLLKAPKYRYLLGPVSIPNEYAAISKALVVEFLMANNYNSEYGSLIRARNPFKANVAKKIDLQVFLRYTHKDVGRLDKFIQEVDPHFKLPILLKKYLSVNSEVLGFNVDPLFNNCLDALIILDLFEVPFEKIEALSKEINDQSILERFRR